MNITVIGAGTMGTGIAQLLMASESVTDLTLYSRKSSSLEALLNTCERNLSKMLDKSKITAEIFEQARQKTRLATMLQDAVASSDLIIEAVSEDYIAKIEVIKSVAQYVSKNTVFASNTSSLSITELGVHFPYPENIVGLHFFNPAPVMELVEIVKGFVTSDAVLEQMLQFAKQLNKSPIVVNEAPGFVVNRMLIPMINEAICILAEDVASAEDIDKAMIYGAHHPMGPLRLSDLIGNDVVLSIMDTLYQETGDSKYRAHPLLRKMVRAEHLGRKSSIGFFEY